MILSIIISLITTIIVLSWLKFYKFKNLPPGPWGIPILGILPFLDKPPNIKFQDYVKKYGKICSFNYGQLFAVILSDYEIIKDAFVRQADNFAARPQSFPWRVFPEDNGIILSEGHLFKQYKSFIMSTLKDFGAVRKHFEIIVKENAEHFVQYLQTLDDQPVNILEPLGLSITQTYCQLLLGKKFEYNDPTFKRLVNLCYRQQRCYNNGVRICLPWTRKLPFIKTLVGEDEIREIKRDVYEIYEKIVDDHYKNYIEGSRDSFIHTWFTEDLKLKQINPNDNTFSRKLLPHNLDVILCAGYETTTSTLRWAFLYLIQHPEIQEKLIQEIESVVGHERFPSLDDVRNLNYTSATILEVHRLATIVPLSVTHRNKAETTLNGYYIPKDSVIYANLYSVHMNPDIFPDPYEFKPERFIDSNGKFRKSEFVIPFSMGKRQCPGEPMAHAEIFIYFTYILQRFRIKNANKDLPSTCRTESVSEAPTDFKLIFSRTHSNI